MEAARFMAIFFAIFVAIFFVVISIFDPSGDQRKAARAKRIAETEPLRKFTKIQGRSSYVNRQSFMPLLQNYFAFRKRHSSTHSLDAATKAVFTLG
jgi:hypothetical protein